MRITTTLLLWAALGLGGAASAGAQPPAAPPEVLVAPAGTVDETTALTFRVRASAADQQHGRWAAVLKAGNDGAAELRPTAADPSVYERTFRLRNEKAFAGQRDSDYTFDFSLPETTAELFPGTVTWTVAFFPDGDHSRTGDPATQTAEQSFEYKPTFESRHEVGKPSLPRARSRLIVPNRSIGGVRPGFSRKQVLKRWGAPFVTDESLYERDDYWSEGRVKNGRPVARGDDVGITYDQDEVSLIYLHRPRAHPGGLSGWKTSRGIGLGSSRRAFRRAYPGAKLSDEEDETLEVYTLRKNGVSTIFDFDHRTHRIKQIALHNYF